MGQLKDADMKRMMPLFVESDSPPDHKCGSCFMRIPDKGDVGICAIKAGSISMKSGVCLYWSKGNAGSLDDLHAGRMDDVTSGYEEAKGAVQCATCKFMDDGYCKLWMGTVKPGQCCVSWTGK